MDAKFFAIDEPLDPTSEKQVAFYVSALITELRSNRTQALIDGTLQAVAATAEAIVRSKLPHRTVEETGIEANELVKVLNHAVADYIERRTKFEGN